MMQNLMKRAAVAVLGMIVTLAWWSIRGDDTTEGMNSIPTVVWSGGAGKVTIEVESSEPSRMALMLSQNTEDGKSLEAHELVAAGRHSWTIDVPADVSAHISLSAENKPAVGAKMSWTIKVNGRVIDTQENKLEEPLREGWGFGLVAEIADLAKGTLEDEE